jgi:outer membrane protein assembly factor BamB
MNALRSGSVVFAFALLAACKPDAREAVAAPAPSGQPRPAMDLVVLPNNVAVLSAERRLMGLQGDNRVAWELRLPNDDVAIAPMAVALNSVAYVRGRKGIYAVLPDGKLSWQKSLEGRPRDAELDAPAALSDSTAAVVTGDDILRFDHAGSVRWRLTLPEGHQTGRLVGTMDGSLLIPTSAGIYSITSDGNVAWRHQL